MAVHSIFLLKRTVGLICHILSLTPPSYPSDSLPNQRSPSPLPLIPLILSQISGAEELERQAMRWRRWAVEAARGGKQRVASAAPPRPPPALASCKQRDFSLATARHPRLSQVPQAAPSSPRRRPWWRETEVREGEEREWWFWKEGDIKR